LSKRKKYSTVVIFDKSQADPTHLRVSSKHIDRWKTYLISGISFVIILVLSLIFYAKQASKNERAAELLHEYQEEVLKPLAIDTNVAKEYIDKIDRKVERIERYLKNRGIELINSKYFSEDGRRPAKQAIQTYVNYEKYMSELIVKLKGTPLGVPINNKISSRFGYRRNPFGGGRSKFHSGLDFEGAKGEKVYATAKGKVVIAGWHHGYGKCVVIEHSSGYKTLYGHLSRINVKQGQIVLPDEVVGLVGNTGQSTGTHLHYEVHRYNRAVNPAKFLTLNS